MKNLQFHHILTKTIEVTFEIQAVPDISGDCISPQNIRCCHDRNGIVECLETSLELMEFQMKCNSKHWFKAFIMNIPAMSSINPPSRSNGS